MKPIVLLLLVVALAGGAFLLINSMDESDAPATPPASGGPGDGPGDGPLPLDVLLVIANMTPTIPPIKSSKSNQKIGLFHISDFLPFLFLLDFVLEISKAGIFYYINNNY